MTSLWSLTVFLWKIGRMLEKGMDHCMQWEVGYSIKKDYSSSEKFYGSLKDVKSQSQRTMMGLYRNKIIQSAW